MVREKESEMNGNRMAGAIAGGLVAGLGITALMIAG